MTTINYKFVDGHTEAIEVTEEFAKEYAKLEHEEQKAHEREKKRRKNIVSLDLLTEKGVDIPDVSSPDPLQALLKKEANKITLIELADFLTPRQKQVTAIYGTPAPNSTMCMTAVIQPIKLQTTILLPKTFWNISSKRTQPTFHACVAL